MNTTYVPIMKWKRGEQNGIVNLDDTIKTQIVPLFEVQIHSKGPEKFRDELEKVWEKRPYYFYLSQDWYEDFDDDDPEEFQKFALDTYFEHYSVLNPSYAIPVFDLSNLFGIKKWLKDYSSRLAIRIKGNEFGLVEIELNKLLHDPIQRRSIDLILDLRSVDGENLFSKQALLKAAILDIFSPDSYRSIIVASDSFPSNLGRIEQETICEYNRNEMEIHQLALRLAGKLKFSYSYADYGPTDLSDTTFVIGMSPNFKIKYTGFDKYYYIKGLSLKKGGLDFDQVQRICKILYSEKAVYSGDNFSWADMKIAEIAKATKKIATGNLTTWVSYSFNHHITFIAKQI